MTAFAEQQEYRDRMSRHDMTVGDECRRWSTCDRCNLQSPQMTVWQEQEDWEWEHQGPFDCPAPSPERFYDEGLGQWNYPAEWTFTRVLEPAGELVPAARRFDVTPFPARDRRPVIYTDIRRPVDEERGAA